MEMDHRITKWILCRVEDLVVVAEDDSRGGIASLSAAVLAWTLAKSAIAYLEWRSGVDHRRALRACKAIAMEAGMTEKEAERRAPEMLAFRLRQLEESECPHCRQRQ